MTVKFQFRLTSKNVFHRQFSLQCKKWPRLKIVLTCFSLSLSSAVPAADAVSADSQNITPTVQSKPTYEVISQQDIIYAEGLSHKSINSANAATIPLKLDIYEPDNDIKNRPVFMFIHGGAFVGGSKQQGQIIDWANYYTSRGWVFISIDYRLKKHKGTVPKQWLEFSSNVPKKKRGQFLAIYPAIRDAKAAMRWIINNAKTYNINTDYITVGGGSAGAAAAISLGISELTDFRDELSLKQDPTLATTHLEHSYHVFIFLR